jgi:hypothetical protein
VNPPGPDRSGEVVRNRYELQRVVGSGGFGVTYAALDRATSMPVAVKELVSPAAEGGPGEVLAAAQRYVQEGQTLRRLNHPNVVRILDSFYEGDVAFLVMELLVGPSLQEVVTEQGPWPEQRMIELLDALCPALDAVHQLGALHRDVKPSNVMLVPNRGPVLIDFGSSRNTNFDQSANLTQIVSPGYAAPEQYGPRGRLGPYTDVYGLGSVVYFAMTGSAPPTATQRLAGEEPESLAARCITNLGRATDQALALRAGDRPQTITQFREAIGAPVANRQDVPVSLPQAIYVEGPARLAASARHIPIDPLPIDPLPLNRSPEPLVHEPVETQSGRIPVVVRAGAALLVLGLLGLGLAVAARRGTDAAGPQVQSPFIGAMYRSRLGAQHASFRTYLEAEQRLRPGLPIRWCDLSEVVANECLDEWRRLDGLVGVIGPTTSDDAQQISALIDPGTPVLLVGAARDSLATTDRDKAVFRLTVSSRQYGARAAAEALRDKRRVAWVVATDVPPESDPWAGARQEFESAFTDGGGSVMTASQAEKPLVSTVDASTVDASAVDAVVTFGLNGAAVDQVVRSLGRSWKGSVFLSGAGGQATGTGCGRQISCQLIDAGVDDVGPYASLAESFPTAPWAVVAADAYAGLSEVAARILTSEDRLYRLRRKAAAELRRSGFSATDDVLVRASYRFDAVGNNLDAQSVSLRFQRGRGFVCVMRSTDRCTAP